MKLFTSFRRPLSPSTQFSQVTSPIMLMVHQFGLLHIHVRIIMYFIVTWLKNLEFHQKIIEILGNHDTWGRINFTDRYRRYLYSKDKIDKNFYCQTYIKNNVRVVGFAPIHFPTGHTTFHFVIPLYKEQPDALEDALDETNDENVNITIFGMHFTTGMMYPLESVRSTKTNRNLKEILSDKKYNIYGMLTGHTHPPNGFDYIHYGNTIELTSTALLEMDGFGIFSVDNQRINYKMYYQNQTNLAILTSPTPNKLATRIFNDEKFQIRVVALSPNAKDFFVSGDVTGKLSFQRKVGETGEASLYAMDVNLKPGNYSITISGDLNETCEFSIGVPVGPFYEEKSIDLLGHVMFIYFAIVSVYLLIIFFFMILPKSMFLSFYKQFEWLNFLNNGNKLQQSSKQENKNNKNENNETQNKKEKNYGKSERCAMRLVKPMWFNSIFGGPITTGRFLSLLPAPFKMFVGFLIISPYVVPVGLYLIEDKIGYYTFCGIYYNGGMTFDAFSLMFTFFYIGFLVIPLLNLFILTMFEKLSFSIVLDVIYNLLMIVVSIVFWQTYGDDRGMPVILRVTFHFHVIPVVSVLFLIIVITLKLKNKKVNKSKTE
ncbi:hypothetical protein TRFO_39227 [Tritrichomonas foetus]|uniref:Calcineurin-like phosphoesterase domain-containing protein n=1 Tax=Tritrichomonas foetus TaxID=1144522 RepID=A0A1J4J7F8_9EUKA|nr:hypothetical protein TRFO_39227 [Tritrichomonas foetus]|eukprot:OHS94585.1 hypothetical protein TRFO_39227 [Tritrichomonas foetus]